MSIKWIFFDVGSTLVNEEGSHRARFEEAAKKIRENCGEDISFEEFCLLMEEGAAKRRSSPFYYALKRFKITTKYHYSCDGESPYPEAAEILNVLKQKYKIGIIANQSKELDGRLKLYGLFNYFDAVFGSDDVGLTKPDVEFYNFALIKTGCLPEEAVMIGDRLDNDIVPAKKAGMKTIRIKQGYFRTVKAIKEEETPDFTINVLSELPEVLEKLNS